MRTQAAVMRTFIFGAVVLGIVLVGAVFVTRSGEQSMDGRAQTVTLNALPSIEHLTVACDALRDLEAHADDYPDLSAAAQPAGRETLDADWRWMDSELSSYLSFPFFEGERDLYDSTVPPALRSLTEALTRLTIAVQAHNVAEARVVADRDVRVAANAVAIRIRALVRLNASHAYAEVTGLSDNHRRFARLELVFDALAIVLGIGMGILLLRQFRAHDKLSQKHSAVIEQRANELEVFGQRVAHDLLSPLSALTYCLGAFKRTAESDPKLQDALARARSCVTRAQKMVDAIFDFARAGGRPRPGSRADLQEVLDEVQQELREAAPGDPPQVTVETFENGLVACSPGVLASILGNLMSNAAKYMRDSAEKRITVRVRERSDSIRVEVEDTGPGVSKGLEGRLFEPYVRAEGVTQAGLGLGLATVKRLCEGHGGDVGVRSTIGRGSVFWFTLPKASASVESEPPVSVASVRRIR